MLEKFRGKKETKPVKHTDRAQDERQTSEGPEGCGGKQNDSEQDKGCCMDTGRKMLHSPGVAKLAERSLGFLVPHFHHVEESWM